MRQLSTRLQFLDHEQLHEFERLSCRNTASYFIARLCIDDGSAVGQSFISGFSAFTRDLSAFQVPVYRLKYLEALRDGWLPPDGNTLRRYILRDAVIQAFFDNVLRTFNAVLNEISSTLQLLGNLLDIIQVA